MLFEMTAKPTLMQVSITIDDANTKCKVAKAHRTKLEHTLKAETRTIKVA